MNNGQLVFLKEWRKRRKARVQPKESVEVDGCIVSAAAGLGNRDAGAHAVIIRLAEGDHNVQAVGGSALEQHNELLLPCRGRGGNGALQEGGDGAKPDERDSALLHEIAPREFRGPHAFATVIAHVNSLGVRRLAAAFTV